MNQNTFTTRSLYHGWLPRSVACHRAFLEKHVAATLRGGIVDDNAWVTEFISAIENSPVMKPLSDAMFRQVNKDPKWESSDERFRVRDLSHLKNALNSVLSTPPAVIVVTDDDGQKIGEPIGVPIYLILDLLSNTAAAYDLFRLEEFNKATQTLLENWGNYLAQPGSNTTLTQEEDGWFSPYALSVLEQGLKGLSFEATYGPDPSQAQQAYPSWDAFFTRNFTDIDKLRPVQSFGSQVTVIYNACESTSLRTAENVQLDDTFWLKGQNYSLYDMLGGDPETNPKSLSQYASSFVGGSVYQAFLSPQDYHHWHSPIKGTLLAVSILPGSYYAVLPDDGAPADDPDLTTGDPHGALIRSQPWLSVSAARCVFVIQPEASSDLEMVAVIGIGMAEVSSLSLSDRLSQLPVDVAAGEHLGMFHFGGSSHTLILKPKENKKVIYEDTNDIPITPGQHRWVRSIIGRVISE